MRNHGLEDYDGEVRTLLEAILSAYEAHGEAELATQQLSRFLKARYGSVSEGKTRLGGDLKAIHSAFRDMQAGLYAS